MSDLVHVIDDDVCFLTAIKRRLKHAGYEVATYVSSKHFLDRLPSESVPSCILLDVQMPGLDGPALQSRLSEVGSTLPIIFLTGHPDIPTTVRTIKAGANDFLTKPVLSDELLRAIERAIAHHEATFGRKRRLDMVRDRIATLTPREREVFELVIRGDTNKQAARALGCTERTVKAHRHRVMEKTQVQSLVELVSLAERVGVFESVALRSSMAGPVNKAVTENLRNLHIARCPAGEGKIEKVAPVRFSAIETMDIGLDPGAAVSEPITRAPFAFNGKIDRAVVERQPSRRSEVEGMQRKAVIK
jgi:FixJ family two-component response regulator